MALQPYFFQQDTEIYLGHAFGQNLRVNPVHLNNLDSHGANGKYSTWHIELEGKNYCKLKNNASGKYLRIWKNGELIDAQGQGGVFTKFKIHFIQSPNVILLESDHFPKNYVAVNANGDVTIGKGGPYCQFHVYHANHNNLTLHNIIHNVQDTIFPSRVEQQQSFLPPSQIQQPMTQPFMHEYLFQKNNIVVIKSVHGNHLRVDPNNLQYADGNGGIGEYAQWQTELCGNNIIRLKSVKNGKYLRIHNFGKSIDVNGVGGEYCNFMYYQNGNTIKLESLIFKGNYIAIKPNHNVEIGSGGPHCVLYFYRKD